MSILMAIVMIVVYILTALIAGRETVTALSGGQNFIIYTLIQALTFVAGVLVLLQGVRMFLGEIIPHLRASVRSWFPGQTGSRHRFFWRRTDGDHGWFPGGDGGRYHQHHDYDQDERSRASGE